MICLGLIRCDSTMADNSVSPHNFHEGNEAERSTGSLGCPLGRAHNTAQKFAKAWLKIRFFNPPLDIVSRPGGLSRFFSTVLTADSQATIKAHKWTLSFLRVSYRPLMFIIVIRRRGLAVFWGSPLCRCSVAAMKLTEDRGAFHTFFLTCSRYSHAA